MKKLIACLFGLMVSMPVAIAGDCNLWDLNNMGFSSNLEYSITETGFTAQGDSNLGKYVYSKTVYEAGTYILTFDDSVSTTYVVYSASDLSKISLNGYVVTTDNTGIKQTLGMGHGAFITNSNGKVIIESAVPFKIGFAIPPSITTSNLQIKKGTAITEYTPYNANCFTCEGNFVQSHNLTQKVINHTITGNGASQSAFSININDITYKPNTQYTITLDVEAHDITYSQSGNLLWWSIQYTDDSYTYAGIMTYNYMNPRVSVVTSANKTVKAINGPQTHQRWTGGTLKVSNLQIEEGTTATPYIPYGETACIPIIKIATTKYNAARFDPLVTTLNTAIAKIKDVVATTIEQTKAVASLQANKQRRPNDNEECPAGKKCLLVEDNNGIPHWYEIVESYYNPTLPSGFTELAYLESTGTQWIDTNILSSSNVGIDVVIQYTDLSGSGEQYSFGLGGLSSGLRFAFGKTNAQNFCGYNTYSGNIPNLSFVENTTYNIKLGLINNVREANVNSTFVVDLSSYNDTWTDTRTIPLFCRKTTAAGTPADYAKIKMYSAKIYSNNTLVRDMIPARRESDGVLGMYDLADSNPATAFHTNAGSGEFTAGPVVLPAGFTTLQYVNMAAGSYLLTDIVPTYDSRVEMDFATTTVLAQGASLLGGRTAASPDGLNAGWTTPKQFLADGFGSSRYTSNYVMVDNTRYKYVWNNNTVSLMTGGTTVATKTFTGSTATGGALCINALNSNGTVVGNTADIYLYSFKAWNSSGNLVANYIPAKQGNTVGFYDTVTGDFKTATSGTFTGGTPAQ